jgi:predicted GH43/DUF377 family glycosyl hydrolase
MKPIQIKRTRHQLLPDARRVFLKPFVPGEESLLPGSTRAHLLMARVLAIPESQVAQLNAEIQARFENRHHGFDGTLERHFEQVSHYVPAGVQLSAARQRLVGAYFSHEYSIEAAALFNPSIVPAPDQRGTAAGTLRFVMSLRAVGEGHMSSIAFRTGVLDAQAELTFDPPSTHVVGGSRTSAPTFNKRHFSTKLVELGGGNELSASVLARLPDAFNLDELETSLQLLEAHGPAQAISFETIKIIRALSSSNYVTTFPADSELSERVIFPAGPHETRGMEDARFVRFLDVEGRGRYYATYTAYDGFEILPQLIETEDFVRFSISTLNGSAAQNKGMALFPRKIGGRYIMLSRRDRENLHLASSDEVHQWNDSTELHRPQSPWELLQIGNCGSPIETEAGWLVLTHGVGPMRRYAIGALLLDLKDPERVIGYLPQPLLEPDENEREGYVPNVVYTCGAIVHAGQLIIPYGFSDAGVGVAQVALDELLQKLLASQHPKHERPRSHPPS